MSLREPCPQTLRSEAYVVLNIVRCILTYIGLVQLFFLFVVPLFYTTDLFSPAVKTVRDTMPTWVTLAASLAGLSLILGLWVRPCRQIAPFVWGVTIFASGMTSVGVSVNFFFIYGFAYPLLPVALILVNQTTKKYHVPGAI